MAQMRDTARRIRLGFKYRYARYRRAHSSATFIGVTGSSGKSTTAALLSHILEGHGAVHGQFLNNTIIALEPALRRMPRWLDYFVMEAGIDAVGKMQRMATLLRPDVAIVTMINNEHYSSFRGMDTTAFEKGYLVEAVQPGGFAMLNVDDERVAAMAARTKERVVTFGWSENADYRVRSATLTPAGHLCLEIAWRSGSLQLRTRFLGEHFWLATAAAAVTALELGVSPGTVAERAASFEGFFNRFQLFAPPNGPRFIIDSAKAPNDTLATAIEAFGKLEAGYKRIVLGQISDYPGNPVSRYRDAYKAARQAADQVIFVGDNAHKSRAPEEDRASGRFLEFSDPKAVSDYLRRTAGGDDLILLKGSRNLHLERIALAWANEVKCWEPVCGLKGDCGRCGLYGFPFREHEGIRRRQKREERINRVMKWGPVLLKRFTGGSIIRKP